MAETAERILIAGGPRMGKTTLAARLEQELGIPVRHTDDLVGQFDWSGVSEEVSRWIAQPGPWIIEGVAVPRALRKWLLAHPEGKPADKVYWVANSGALLTKGQLTMHKGCLTVWQEIEDELRRRGVKVIGYKQATPAGAPPVIRDLEAPAASSRTVKEILRRRFI